MELNYEIFEKLLVSGKYKIIYSTNTGSYFLIRVKTKLFKSAVYFRIDKHRIEGVSFSTPEISLNVTHDPAIILKESTPPLFPFNDELQKKLLDILNSSLKKDNLLEDIITNLESL